MMTIAELHRVLETALRKGVLTQDAEAAAAFQVISSLLADYPDFSVEEFSVKARDGLKKKSNGKKTASLPLVKATKAAKTVVLSEPAIGRYLGELEQTKFDSRQFEKVVDRMKKDREVKVSEAREIARRFTSSSQTYRTKPEAAKAILQRQITDVRTAGKAEHIPDIF
jgi:hypothetical protein